MRLNMYEKKLHLIGLFATKTVLTVAITRPVHIYSNDDKKKMSKKTEQNLLMVRCRLLKKTLETAVVDHVACKK